MTLTYIQGLISGVAAFVIWGLLPLYWHAVDAISPYQIFAQRVVWSLVFVLIIIVVTKQSSGFLAILRDQKNWLYILGPACFISINWLTYIWSVNNGYVIESSLGYYMNPIVLTLFGSMFYHEKMTKLQKVGMGFAFSGVIIKTFMYGRIPYIALILAISFAVYGLLKKKSKLSSIYGLGFETIVISIPAGIYLFTQEISGLGISGNLPSYFWPLIMLSGIVTAVPLLLYSESAKKLPLTILGFLQYIGPTFALFLGIFVFQETFVAIDLLPFALIWIGLGFFTYSQISLLKK